jgi:hypothetical protein
MNNENFDNLWDRLKEQVRTARGDREAIYTNGENALTQHAGGRIWVDPSATDGMHYVGVGIRRADVHFYATSDDLLTIAAKCIATAIDSTDEQQA